MWLVYAFVGSIFAALVTIFAKLGLQNLNSTLVTTIRSIVMTVFLVGVSLFLPKPSLNSISTKQWSLIILSGLAGAISWIFYFLALKYGPASKVASIDRLSIVFIAILAFFFLQEQISPKNIIGIIVLFTGIMLTLSK